MKIRLSTLRKIIREEVYRNNFWYGMSGMNNAGAGAALNNPTVRGTDYRVPPGLGLDTEIVENEEQETYEEEEELSARDE